MEKKNDRYTELHHFNWEHFYQEQYQQYKNAQKSFTFPEYEKNKRIQEERERYEQLQNEKEFLDKVSGNLKDTKSSQKESENCPFEDEIKERERIEKIIYKMDKGDKIRSTASLLLSFFSFIWMILSICFWLNGITPFFLCPIASVFTILSFIFCLAHLDLFFEVVLKWEPYDIFGDDPDPKFVPKIIIYFLVAIFGGGGFIGMVYTFPLI